MTQTTPKVIPDLGSSGWAPPSPGEQLQNISPFFGGGLILSSNKDSADLVSSQLESLESMVVLDVFLKASECLLLFVLALFV